MAKSVSRVNGKGGESMWASEGEVRFRTNGKVRKMEQSELTSAKILNAEEARKLVGETELLPYGAWTEEMPSTKGKSDFVVVADSESCWVMEVSKNQNPNALSFVRELMPQDRVEAEDYKLYAAIQTPRGGLFTIGSIVGVGLAMYFIFSLQMPIPGIVCAVAAIVMFLNVK